MFLSKRTSQVAKPATDTAALEKRMAAMEKEIAALTQWRAEVTETLKNLGIGHKIQDPKHPLQKQTEHRGIAAKPIPMWFCSYCWTNSKSAYQLKEVSEYKGDADPREIWRKLWEEAKLMGWLDKEFLGSAGLFDDIAEGIMDSKVMVAFISDDYAQSENCIAEFTYAKKYLRIPVIPVIVGNGWHWKTTKLALLLSDALYIDMTDASKVAEKVDELKKRLLDLVGSEEGYLKETGQVDSVDNVKVGDAVEKYANDALNFSTQFQKIALKESTAGDFLFAWYWWPCEVIEINEQGGYKLHYWGYDSSWDTWVSKGDRKRLVRPMQYPSVNVGDLKEGDRIEVRLYQDTKVADKDASKAYCWVASTVVSFDGTNVVANVDLDLEKLKGQPKIDPEHPNFFRPDFTPSSGFYQVTVSAAAVRRI